MAIETERKFLVEGTGWRARAGAAVSIRQFYLAAGADRSVRVRIRDGQAARLTLKFGEVARSRHEYEYDIPLDEAGEMQAFALGTPIDKLRHIVVEDGRNWEVDVFAGALDGLVLAEIETADELPSGALPGWVGREVTEDAAYYNASLSLNGRPVIS